MLPLNADSLRTHEQENVEGIRTNLIAKRQVLDAKLQILTASTKSMSKRVALLATSPAASFPEVQGTI